MKRLQSIENSNGLTSFLSSSLISSIVLVIAIGARVLMQVYFFDYTGDRSYQLVAARNFLDGHGLTVNQVMTSNLQQTVFKPLVGWPPGYSLFLSLFIFICNNNFYLASLLLDLVCVALFVIYSRKILMLCNLPAWLLNLYTLLTGFFIFDFAYASTTDFNTLSLFLIAFYYTLRFISTEKKPPFAILIGILLFLAPLFRYMYAAVIIGVPVYLVAYGIGTKNRRLLRGGIYCAVTISVLVSALFLFQKHFTGASTYIIPSPKGFYPANVFRTYPVLLTPFVDLMFLCVSISKYFSVDFVGVVDFIRLLHLAPFTLVFSWSLLYLWKKKFAAQSTTMHYLVMGLGCSVLNVLLLLYLSLRNAPILSITYPVWTFLEEARYFAFPVVFIQQMAFLIFFRSFPLLTGWKKRIAYVMVALFAIQLLHGVYYVARISIFEKNNFTIHKTNRILEDSLYSIMADTKREHPGENIIVTSNDPSFPNLASLKGEGAYYNCYDMNHPEQFGTDKPVHFIVVLRDKIMPRLQDFIANPNTKFKVQVGAYYFYTINVSPSSTYQGVYHHSNF